MNDNTKTEPKVLVNIKIDPELWAQVKHDVTDRQLARKDNRTISSWFESAARERLEREGK